jgi:DNA-binding response OmpR family regulator
MTLTPLHGRTIHRSIRPSRTHTPSSWTLTVEVTISGDGPDPQTRELLRDLRRLAERSDAARRDHAAVTVAAGLARTLDDARVLHIDAAARVVRQGDRVLTLSRLEFELLLFLTQHPGQVFTREQLLNQVWGYPNDIGRTVDVHIRRLRVKSGEVPLVTTVRGVGYRLADDARVEITRPQPDR